MATARSKAGTQQDVPAVDEPTKEAPVAEKAADKPAAADAPDTTPVVPASTDEENAILAGLEQNPSLVTRLRQLLGLDIPSAPVAQPDPVDEVSDRASHYPVNDTLRESYTTDSAASAAGVDPSQVLDFTVRGGAADSNDKTTYLVVVTVDGNKIAVEV